ncbi:hypothetical protein [uncultured Aquimarina sp.]|uniref:hypothetical protein n=1 Tax=uncultured Aquimarina sp. TaxID=575652 RepID=UPI0026096D43|nr:hypothetical protein [uncultured Aquimarina sp.]
MANDDYNKIFENLVEDEGNLIGLIAYSLYKQEKRKEIVKIANGGKKPTKTQIKRIESVLSNQLEGFKEQANILLDTTFEYLVSENLDNIYSEYFLTKDIDKLSKRDSLWTKLWQSVFFRICWVFLIAIISIILYYNIDSLKAVGENFHKTFVENKAE